MLAYILAIAIVLASLIFFFSAFFAPKLHRKDDFLWSGVGLFYGLVLWVCAGRITGGVLLGQMAAVTLVLSFTWQTISLRGAIANPEKIPNIKTFSLLDWIGGGLGKKKAKVKPAETTPVQPQPEVVTNVNEKVETVTDAITDTVPLPTQVSVPPQEIETVTEIPESEDVTQAEMTVTDVEPAMETDVEIEETVEDIPVDEVAVEPNPPVTPPIVTASTKTKKPNFFSRFFGKKQPKAKPESITSVIDAIDESDSDWGDSQDNEAAIASETVNNNVEEPVTTESVTVTVEDSPETELADENPGIETEILTVPETIAAVIEDSSNDEVAKELEEDWETEEFESFEDTADEYAPTKIETVSFSKTIMVSTTEDTPDAEDQGKVIEVYQVEAAVETITYEQEENEPETLAEEDNSPSEDGEENHDSTPDDASNQESEPTTPEEEVLEKVADLPDDNPDIHG